jgi:hypothetical protein
MNLPTIIRESSLWMIGGKISSPTLFEEVASGKGDWFRREGVLALDEEQGRLARRLGRGHQIVKDPGDFPQARSGRRWYDFNRMSL